jgi:hypothetical protein
MQIYPDFRAFVELLNAHRVEYLIVGAHALAFHGRPRYTNDLDIFVRRSPENLAALLRVLDAFGFGSLKLTEVDFGADSFVQLGVAPVRIDITTSISGLEFEEAWKGRIEGKLGDLPVFFPSIDSYIKNKRASGRPKDLADIDELTSDG